MALIVKDRVKETTNTGGTGSVTLAGAVYGFQTFASTLSNGDTTYYAIVDGGNAQFEVGLGTYSGGVLSRTTVLESSNAGAKVNFSTDPKEVFITYPAEKSVYHDASDDVTLKGNLVVPSTVSANIFEHTGSTGSTILKSNNKALIKRLSANGAMRIGSDDTVILAGGEAGGAIEGNVDPIGEYVYIGAEGGVKLYAFPNNNVDWTNRVQASFGADGIFHAPELYINGSRALTVSDEGSGNGLDADTLDGYEATYFTTYTDNAVASIVDSSPATLDTLNELAAALGDDPNFATTVSNEIGTKVSKSGDTMTGTLTVPQIFVNNSIFKQYSGDADITSLISGSTFGTMIEGVPNGHVVVGLRENGSDDTFAILSGGGNYTSDNTYDTVVASFNAGGAVGIGTNSPQYNLDVVGTANFQSNIIVSGYANVHNAEVRGELNMTNTTTNIIDAYSGELRIRTAANDGTAVENAIVAQRNAEVALYHDNLVKFQTTASGAKTFGYHELSGTAPRLYFLGSGSGRDHRIDSEATLDISADYNSVGGSGIRFKVGNSVRSVLDLGGLGIGTGNASAQGTNRLEVTRLQTPKTINNLNGLSTVLVQAGDGALGSGAGITVAGGTASGVAIFFGDDEDAQKGRVVYDNSNDSLAFYSNGDAKLILQSNNDVRPAADGTQQFGTASYRWSDIYAVNGTIQTSDANQKQQISELTPEEIKAGTALTKLFKTFKWNDAVELKGEGARTHTGVIAQDVARVLLENGLSPDKYAFFTSSTWWEYTEVLEEGEVLRVAHSKEEAPEGAVEVTRKGIRYPELLAFIAAATEHRLSAIEDRLALLEALPT